MELKQAEWRWPKAVVQDPSTKDSCTPSDEWNRTSKSRVSKGEEWWLTPQFSGTEINNQARPEIQGCSIWDKSWTLAFSKFILSESSSNLSTTTPRKAAAWSNLWLNELISLLLVSPNLILALILCPLLCYIKMGFSHCKDCCWKEQEVSVRAQSSKCLLLFCPFILKACMGGEEITSIR